MNASFDTMTLDVLIVEDEPSIAAALVRVVENAGYEVESVQTSTAALQMAEFLRPRLVLLDLSLPDATGVDLISKLKLKGVKEVIVVSGTQNAEITRRCLTAGVFDFIQKPAKSSEIVRSLRRADGARRLLSREVLESPSPLELGFGSLEGNSHASVKLLDDLNHIATQPRYNALITGQPGVLKCDVAALLHRYAERGGGGVLVNCASENDQLSLARFFRSGHEVCGANLPLTYLESAQDGTLVLDDLTTLPIHVQQALSEYIDDASGGKKNDVFVDPHNCCVVGIIREPIESALSEGRLYEPLLQQLAINTVSVPSLIERKQDIEFFASKAVEYLNEAYDSEKCLSKAFIRRLSVHHWPGNMVELKNCIFQAYQATENGEEINPKSMFLTQNNHRASKRISLLVGQSYTVVEKQLIEATLEANRNNKSKSAEVLGVSLKTLYNRLSSYDSTRDFTDKH